MESQKNSLAMKFFKILLVCQSTLLIAPWSHNVLKTPTPSYSNQCDQMCTVTVCITTEHVSVQTRCFVTKPSHPSQTNLTISWFKLSKYPLFSYIFKPEFQTILLGWILFIVWPPGCWPVFSFYYFYHWRLQCIMKH